MRRFLVLPLLTAACASAAQDTSERPDFRIYDKAAVAKSGDGLRVTCNAPANCDGLPRGPLVLRGEPIVTARDVASAAARAHPSVGPYVEVRLDDEGNERYRDWSRKASNRADAPVEIVVVDGRVGSQVFALPEIDPRPRILVRTRAEAKTLATALEGGR